MKKPLVIFLGNLIFSDDRVGLEVGRLLREKLSGSGYDVELLEGGGLELIEYLEGRDEVVFVDAVRTLKSPPGSVLELSLEELKLYAPRSPHYAGVPEAVKMMRALDLNPPRKLRIIGIEVENPYALGDELSANLKQKLPKIAEEVYSKIMGV